MCHPGFDPAVRCAATTGPPLATTLTRQGAVMPSIDHVILDVPDTTAAETFYTSAFELGDAVRVRESRDPASGFRGFPLSLVVSQPADVDALIDAGRQAGATTLKPAAKSVWGYGG